jgi:hypothetical protein
MGTQWVGRGRDVDYDDLGSRPSYRPRHAKSARRQQPRSNYVDGEMSGWSPAAGIAEPYIINSCETYGYTSVSIRQVLRDRAATFVRGYSRDERW